MIRSLAAAVLAASALAAAPALAAGDNSPAVKAFRSSAKPILGTFAASLRDTERALAVALDAAVAEPLPPPRPFSPTSSRPIATRSRTPSRPRAWP